MNISTKTPLELAIGTFNDNKILDCIITPIEEGKYYIFLRNSRWANHLVSVIDEFPEVASVSLLHSKVIGSGVVVIVVLLNSWIYDTSSFPSSKLKERLEEIVNKK